MKILMDFLWYFFCRLDRGDLIVPIIKDQTTYLNISKTNFILNTSDLK